ncbi:hypothetical protein [Thermomonospora umbrina]|uniref:Uncharacterized protein n=1 Tax=Thermomonospora umbrina TaxID=111806 RepID=A0A3D9T5N6_9ACTN|nr:hypothetical protein [Thermomonospora umbrina]REF00556.1 hypothetical protein DFJ69_6106 [Thermomonospora umbrina]
MRIRRDAFNVTDAITGATRRSDIVEADPHSLLTTLQDLAPELRDPADPATITEQATTTHRRHERPTAGQRDIAARLFDALRAEVAEWADDTERGWVQTLWDLSPAQALKEMRTSTCVPASLLGPMVDAIRYLDPETFAPVTFESTASETTT